MTTVLLIVHILIASGLVGVILMQRSEGGALGIGGGGPGGMMSGRGAANLLTRVTMFLGAAFVINSILLAIVGATGQGDGLFDNGVPSDRLTTEDLFGDMSGDDSEEGDISLPDLNSDASETPETPSEDSNSEAETTEDDAEDTPQVPGQ